MDSSSSLGLLTSIISKDQVTGVMRLAGSEFDESTFEVRLSPDWVWESRCCRTEGGYEYAAKPPA